METPDKLRKVTAFHGDIRAHDEHDVRIVQIDAQTYGIECLTCGGLLAEEHYFEDEGDEGAPA